jgi:hypothetical protein
MSTKLQLLPYLIQIAVDGNIVRVAIRQTARILHKQDLRGSWKAVYDLAKG